MITPQTTDNYDGSSSSSSNSNKVTDMVAKSLLTFVGVGILSGLALGLYLSEARDGYFIPKTITVTDGPSISVIPTQTVFEEGQQVIFRIINSGSVPLYSYNDGSIYGASITGLAGILIYTFDTQDAIPMQQANQTEQIILHADAQLPFEELPIKTKSEIIKAKAPSASEPDAAATTHDITKMLLPGQGMLISWDQTRQDDESVQAGVYKINIQAYTTQSIDTSSENTPISPTKVKDSFTIIIQ